MLSQVVAQPYAQDEGVGDYLLLEQAGAWIPSSLCICVRAHAGVCVCGHPCGGVGPGMHVLRND